MVIFLNGAINSGKTTVSKLLEGMIARSVRMEIDDLPAPENLPLEEAIKPLLGNAAELARRWHERGFHPIVVWPIGEEDHREFVKRLSEAGAEVFTFTLAPEMGIALKNRGERELTDWERERIKYHYAVGIQRPAFGEILDNTNETPGRTAERILAKLRGVMGS